MFDHLTFFQLLALFIRLYALLWLTTGAAWFAWHVFAVGVWLELDMNFDLPAMMFSRQAQQITPSPLPRSARSAQKHVKPATHKAFDV